MRRGIELLLPVLAWLAVASKASAQNTSGVTLKSGTHVRIQTVDEPREKVKGILASTVSDTLLVAVGDARTVARFPLGVIQTLEVPGGKDRKKGMLIGAGTLGGIGLVFGGIDASRGKISSGDFVGTVIGNAAIGALIGWALAPTGWERVPLIRH